MPSHLRHAPKRRQKHDRPFREQVQSASPTPRPDLPPELRGLDMGDWMSLGHGDVELFAIRRGQAYRNNGDGPSAITPLTQPDVVAIATFILQALDPLDRHAVLKAFHLKDAA